jgi:hypothetical protein
MKLKRFLSVLLALILMLSLNVPFSKAAGSTTLKFNSDGKFKILVFADCQDDNSPYEKMIRFIEDSLDTEQPDLVVFTGDNVVVTSDGNFKTGATKLLQPLIDRDIPYAYTFGNHDAEYGVSKEYMHSVYTSLGTCLTYDADPSLNGLGNCNIPIYSSTGNDIAFNLWMIDSLMYADGGYDHVREDQLEWYKKTSIALEQQVGHKVNSIMFQHIAMPEIYNLLTESSTGSKTYLGKKYSLNLNSNASGYLGEFPCPPAVNGGQFDALLERGDVLGVVTGHDHSNSFHGKYKGIGFLQMPGMSFQSYGDDKCRGYGVIELDEKDTSTYSVHTVTYIDFWNGSAATNTWHDTGYYGDADTGVYISSISIGSAAAASTAKKNLTSGGYTVIDKDLNAGAGGDFIYMGYKTTNDPTKALRDIVFYSAEEESSQTQTTIKVNGKDCLYTRVSDADLNKRAQGNYIYAYTSNDPAAGLPVKAISFGNTSTSSLKVCGTLSSYKRPADLNANAGGEYIYCYLSTLEAIDISALQEKIEFVHNILANSEVYPGSDAVLYGALNKAEDLIKDVNQDDITAFDSEYIDDVIDELDRGLETLLIKVRFVNYDGSEVETAYALYGSAITCSVTPQKPSDEQYHYTFSGWDTDTSDITSSVTSKALYTAEHYHTSEVQATCTEPEVCKYCSEILNEATGHGETVVKNGVKETCTVNGYTGDQCCVDCGQVLIEGEVIEASGHTYGDWVYYIMPTVTQTGTDRSTCSVCKQSVYRESPKATTATVSDDYIYGLTSNVSTTKIRDYFNLKYLSVTAQPSKNNTMGTGSVVSVKQKGVTTNYTVVIFGDVNGDGWYDGQDAIIVSCLADGMLTQEDVTPAEFMAADCNHDGVVDATDVEILNQAGIILSTVEQDINSETFESSSVYSEYIDLIDQSPESEIPTVEDDVQPQQQSVFDLIISFIRQIFDLIMGYIKF